MEVYNDVDEGLVNFWRVLRNPATFDEFHRLATLTPYSRQEHHEAFEGWQEETDPVRRAYLWYIVARQSFSGEHARKSWSYCRTESSGGMSRSTLRWLAAVDRLPEIHARWMPIQIEHADWRVILERYDTPDTLFYCDPPYIPGTRKGGGYRHEMTDPDHRDLVRGLLALQGKAILSGYAHPIYEPLESAGWQRVDFGTHAYAAGRTRQNGLIGDGIATEKQARVESVWISPSAQGGQTRLALE